MKIHLGGSADFFVENRNESVNDYVAVIAYGGESVVRRADGKALRSIFEHGLGDEYHRRVFHLLPYGEYGADPFPDGHEEDERDFSFLVTYARDGEARTATVILRAHLDDPISWVVLISIGDVGIDTDGPDSVNRDIGDSSVVERMGWADFASRMAASE